MNFTQSFLKTKKIHKIAPAKVHEFINPTREWFFGLLVATLFFLLGATYIGIDLHTQFTKNPTFTEVGEASLSYDKNVVVEYARIYREKEAIFSTLRNRRPTVVATTPVPVVEVEEIIPEVLTEASSSEPSGEIILQ